MDSLSTQMQEGLVILFTGMSIVFSSLILLFLVFQYIVPKIISSRIREVYRKNVTSSQVTTDQYHTGEEMAAISAAIHLFIEEVHDEENAILTISKSSKDYSPWSSKIYLTHHLRNQ